MLHLYMGRASYMPDFLIEEKYATYSPLAGQSFSIDDLSIIMIGPGDDGYHYRVALAFKANGLSVETLCEIQCSDLYGIMSVRVECFVDGAELTKRTIHIHNGKLQPAGLAADYDLDRTIGASTYQG